MTQYYVRPDGSDGNAGTGAAAGSAWATISKALGAAGIASGDTLWISPGVFRETVSVAMTSAVAETFVNGDPSASKFSDVAPGPVIWTAYTTNDTTAPSTSALLTLAGRDFLTFQDLVMVAGNASGGAVLGSTTNSVNTTFRRCAMVASGTNSLVAMTALNSVLSNWTFDTCALFAIGNALALTLTRPTGSDFDHAIVVKNCAIWSIAGTGILVQTTGANTSKPGGVTVTACTIQAVTAVNVTANVSTAFPVLVKSCIAFGSTALAANASGQIVEDYCFLMAITLRTNVTAGTHSQTHPTYAPTLDIGQSWLHGFNLRPFLTPMAGCPFLGFGDDGTAPGVDALNRPRPAGGNSTSKGIGYLERHDTAAKETGTTDAGSVGLVIVGPGDADIRIPVDAAATVISVKARYDSTHAATNKPQAILLDNAAIGVTTETKTMTSAADTWDTLTFSSFTPSAKGVVTIRLVSRSAAAGGKSFWDTFVVS